MAAVAKCLQIYCDASFDKDSGQAGLGVCVRQGNREILVGAKKVHNVPHSCAAEALALAWALQIVQANFKGQRGFIYSDNQSLVDRLRKANKLPGGEVMSTAPEQGTSTGMSYKRLFFERLLGRILDLKRGLQWTIQWVRGHAKSFGNCCADYLAKTALRGVKPNLREWVKASEYFSKRYNPGTRYLFAKQT